jgi:hypothetical protein
LIYFAISVDIWPTTGYHAQVDLGRPPLPLSRKSARLEGKPSRRFHPPRLEPGAPNPQITEKERAVSAEDFSSTLVADFAAQSAAQPQLRPAITWLRSNTILAKLSDIQIWLALQSAIANGGFAVSFNGTALTSAV